MNFLRPLTKLIAALQDYRPNVVDEDIQEQIDEHVDALRRRASIACSSSVGFPRLAFFGDLGAGRGGFESCYSILACPKYRAAIEIGGVRFALRSAPAGMPR